MQSKLNAADAITLAAKTFSDPGKEGKEQLDDALKRFQDLNKKYSGYIPGAIALMHLGESYELQGDKDAALDHFLRLSEEPEVDPLRDAKYRAATGLIRLKLAEKPTKYKDALARTESFAKQIRPNEAMSPAIQDFRIALAKAYLAKAADKSLKKGETGRARSNGRDLLREASRVPGIHVDEAEALLADLGIEKEADPLPTAEPPESFEDALEKVTQLSSVAEELRSALDVLEQQKDSDDLKERMADLQSQIDESYQIGVQILRGGLPMATAETNVESINQARQFLAYFLYQLERHRETVVTGTFLARNAPGSDTGLKGGLMALTSMQKLLAEVPDDAN